jgi:hypothetical protein
MGDEPRPLGDRQSPTLDELKSQLIYFDDLFGIRDNFLVKKNIGQNLETQADKMKIITLYESHFK